MNYFLTCNKLEESVLKQTQFCFDPSEQRTPAFTVNQYHSALYNHVIWVFCKQKRQRSAISPPQWTGSVVYKNIHNRFPREQEGRTTQTSLPPGAPCCIPTGPEECSPPFPRAHQKCFDNCLPRPHSQFQGWLVLILIPMKWTSPGQIRENVVK